MRYPVEHLGSRETSSRLGLSRLRLLFLAILAGIAISANYAVQPALPGMAASLNISASRVGVVAGSTLLGYLFGLALLSPLADRLSSHYLVSSQFIVASMALALAAKASTMTSLAILLCVVGAMSTNAAQMSAIASKFAQPANRGRAVGTISAGISTGILLGRFVGGSISEWANWHAMLNIFAAGMFIAAIIAFCLLPRNKPPAVTGYLSMLRDIPRMLTRFSLLKEGIVVGGLWFFIFNCLWVDLTLHLSANPWNLNSAQIGLLSFAGIAGLLVTPLAGSVADRIGARYVITVGMVFVMTACAILIFARYNIFLVVLGIVLFDSGCFAAQVANQSRLYSIDPAFSGRINGAYLIFYYTIGTLGMILGPMLLQSTNWTVVCLTCLVIAGIAIGIVISRSIVENNSSVEN